MKLIRHINEYLLSDDPSEISLSDYITLYGFYSFAALAPIVLWLYIR